MFVYTDKMMFNFFRNMINEFLSIIRYIAVCKPHKYREFNYCVNVPMRILVYSGPVLALSFLLNIPKFYEIEVSNIDIMQKMVVEAFRDDMNWI